ncbi:hypothetical protein QOZ80_5AG0361950 [Eleusine coracana subsp. coracana]|nr:hypothetical protein QOZ80_5AG0361950 [Eleusine coracana subsp. coracana]
MGIPSSNMEDGQRMNLEVGVMMLWWQLTRQDRPVWAKLPAFSSKPAFIWRATSSSLLELEAAAASAVATPSWCWPRQAPLRIPPIDDLLRAVSQTKPNAAVADAHYITKTTTTASGRLGATLRSLHWIAVDDLEREIRSGSGGVDGGPGQEARAARGGRYGYEYAGYIHAASCSSSSPSPPPAPLARPRHGVRRHLHGLDASSISPSYGLAENCTFVSTAWRSDSDHAAAADLPSYKKLLPSARLSSPKQPQEHREIEIVVVDEETGEPVPDGVEGEVWVSSASNAPGYLAHPSATRGSRARASSARVTAASSSREEETSGTCTSSAGAQTSLSSLAPGRLRGGCVAAFTVSSPLLHADGAVVVVAEPQKAGGDHKGRRGHRLRKR